MTPTDLNNLLALIERDIGFNEAKALEAHIEGLAADRDRLDWLEQMANQPQGLLLHSEEGQTGRCGLGLGSTGRTLRRAVDDAMGVEAARSAP